MLIGIDHIVLQVADAERSLAWYVELFGVEPIRVEEWRAGTVPFVSLRVNDGFIIDLVEQVPAGRNIDHFALVCDREFFDQFVRVRRDIIDTGPLSLFGARGQGEGIYLSDPDGHKIELRTY